MNDLERKSFKAGETVFEEGDDGDVAYLVLSGEFIAFRHEGETDRVYSSMGAKNIFGELALIRTGRRTLSVRATKDSECVIVTKDVLERVVERADPILRSLMLGYMDRLKDSSAPDA